MRYGRVQGGVGLSRCLSIVDEMVRLSKNSVNSLLDRAIIFANFGDDTKAKSDLKAAIATGTTSYELHHKSALLALHFGEQQLYRKICENMTLEHSSTKDPEIACWVAWTSALGRNAVENYAAAIRIAKQAVELKPDSRVHLSRLAAILFRSGDFQSARKQQNAAMELPENQKHSIAYDCYFLAMIEHELGPHEHANHS